MGETRDLEKMKQSLQVAELYFEDSLSQAKIAKSMGISRPTVSRLLQFAKDSGLVKIQIINPLVDAKLLSEKLKLRYGVDCHVVPNNYGGYQLLLDSVGQYAADFISKVVESGDVLGLGWGQTIHSVTQKMTIQEATGVRVVELKGSLSYSQEKTWAYESVNELAQAYHTRPEYLPLPVIFDNQTTKEMVEQDRHIKHILDLGKQSDVAVYTVGTVRSEALIFQLGYLSEREKRRVQSEAIGDVFSRFIDQDGRVVDRQLDNRTIGIHLEDLKQKNYSVLVATGNQKASGVRAVLKAGYANHVIIDQSLAQVLLAADDQNSVQVDAVE